MRVEEVEEEREVERAARVRNRDKFVFRSSLVRKNILQYLNFDMRESALYMLTTFVSESNARNSILIFFRNIPKY